MMNWMERYIPPSTTLWQGRADTPDAACFFQIIQPLHLAAIPSSSKQVKFALLGFSCDEGIRRNFGRVGAAEGPNAIRSVLAKFPIQRQDCICYDAGDITCLDQNLEASQLALADAVALLLAHGITPIVLGGGHELAWGHYQGIAKQIADKQLGIINFDAHFDMRPLDPQQLGSSGTPFLQIAQAYQALTTAFHYYCFGIQRAGNIPQLFATAETYQARVLLADTVETNTKEQTLAFVERSINENTYIYLSLCLDVFAAAYAPGVSAPQTLGLTPWQIIPMIRKLAASGKVISYDLAELSPKYDDDQRTTKLAANFIYEIIHHHLLPAEE